LLGRLVRLRYLLGWYDLLVRIRYLLERLVRKGYTPAGHLPTHRPQQHLVPVSFFAIVL
jgi:hypothetical protein